VEPTYYTVTAARLRNINDEDCQEEWVGSAKHLMID